MTADQGDQHPAIETTAGAVRGSHRGGSAVVLGIPHAEPPAGDRRSLALEPRAPWSGVRDALEHGPTPQRRALAEVTAIPEPSVPGDDVLPLDVFTPSTPSIADVLDGPSDVRSGTYGSARVLATDS